MQRHVFLAGALVALAAGVAEAKPPATGVFCATYPSAPACVGQLPACTYCHVAAPQRNAFGTALEAVLAPGAARPLSDNDFAMALPAALAAVEPGDADGDGVGNLTEIEKGTLPADPRSFPSDVPCAGGVNPRYDVCHYDAKYVYRKLLLDVCGASPTWADVKGFAALSETEQQAKLDTELDRCLATEFWRGKNGQLWKVAHPKVRPVGSLKRGEDEGAIPLADYYDDYAIFAYSQTDDHDAREVMTADFYVERLTGPTRYNKVSSRPVQVMDQAHRAGNLTTAWSMVYFVMFTPLPRNVAAQMYRAYLGFDIAKQQGIYSVPNEPRDYDNKGVQDQACAACHATLDPLSYPFRNYNGISGNSSAMYVPNRIETFFASEAPNITQIPEQGAIFGQTVNTVREWAQVGANSDAFAIATCTDYWKLFVGHPPTAEENEEFVLLWQRFKGTHQYRVQKMLHDLIHTEAYGAP